MAAGTYSSYGVNRDTRVLKRMVPLLGVLVGTLSEPQKGCHDSLRRQEWPANCEVLPLSTDL